MKTIPLQLKTVNVWFLRNDEYVNTVFSDTYTQNYLVDVWYERSIVMKIDEKMFFFYEKLLLQSLNKLTKYHNLKDKKQFKET